MKMWEILKNETDHTFFTCIIKTASKSKRKKTQKAKNHTVYLYSLYIHTISMDNFYFDPDKRNCKAIAFEKPIFICFGLFFTMQIINFAEK